MRKRWYLAAFFLCALAAAVLFHWQKGGEKEVQETEEQQKKQIYVLSAYETKLHQQILNEVAENYSSRSAVNSEISNIVYLLVRSTLVCWLKEDAEP